MVRGAAQCPTLTASSRAGPSQADAACTRALTSGQDLRQHRQLGQQVGRRLHQLGRLLRQGSIGAAKQGGREVGRVSGMCANSAQSPAMDQVPQCRPAPHSPSCIQPGSHQIEWVSEHGRQGQRQRAVQVGRHLQYSQTQAVGRVRGHEQGGTGLANSGLARRCCRPAQDAEIQLHSNSACLWQQRPD